MVADLHYQLKFSYYTFVDMLHKYLYVSMLTLAFSLYFPPHFELQIHD